MNNYILNCVSLSGPEQEIDAFINLVRSDTSDFDFNHIIQPGTDGPAKSWGTEWNSINVERNSGHFCFVTRDTAPIKIYAKLVSAFPNLKIKWLFRDLDSQTVHKFVIGKCGIRVVKTKNVIPVYLTSPSHKLSEAC